MQWLSFQADDNEVQSLLEDIEELEEKYSEEAVKIVRFMDREKLQKQLNLSQNNGTGQRK